MALTIGNPRDLALEGLGELLWVERTLAHEGIPKVLEQVKDADLAARLQDHLEETKQHAAYVERAFRAFESEPSAHLSPALEGLMRAQEEIAGSTKADDLRDVFFAGAVVRTEHYEVAAYTSVIALADALGRGEAVDALKRNLKDEEGMLARVEKIARRLSADVV